MSRARVALKLQLSVQSTWWALTDRSSLARWLGDLVGDLTVVGAACAIQVDAANHYSVSVVGVEPGRRLAMVWSHLGVAEPTMVTWSMRPLPDGSTRLLVVEATVPGQMDSVAGASRLDFQAGGPQSAADWAARGALWRARLRALEAHLRGVAEPRDAGLVDVQVCRELPSTTVAPLHQRHVLDWMPAAGMGLAPSAFFIVDSQGPRRFPIVTWTAHYDDRLALGIQIDEERPATPATIRVSVPSGHRLPLLEVRHVGWLDLAGPREQVVTLRSRFEATWQASLKRAALLRPRPRQGA